MNADQLNQHILVLGRKFETDHPIRFRDEGWDLFNTVTPLECGIERHDDLEVFDGDQAALFHVAQLALMGSKLATDALVIHLLANELRGMVWGDAYINSRMGPQ